MNKVCQCIIFTYFYIYILQYWCPLQALACSIQASWSVELQCPCSAWSTEKSLSDQKGLLDGSAFSGSNKVHTVSIFKYTRWEIYFVLILNQFLRSQWHLMQQLYILCDQEHVVEVEHACPKMSTNCSFFIIKIFGLIIFTVFRYPTHEQYDIMVSYLFTTWPYLANEENLLLQETKVMQIYKWM